MAKTKKDIAKQELFPEIIKRRHPHLILPKLITERTIQCPFDDNNLQKSIDALKTWADLAQKGTLRQKETSLNAEFIRVIFAEALAYKRRTDSPDDYNIERQFSVSGAGTADGAIGWFATNKEPRAAIREAYNALS